jgi:tRNA(fMet)-specific endonuclease VapC
MTNSGVMLDTNVVSRLMRDPAGPLLTRLGQQTGAIISIVSLAELRFGIARTGSTRLQTALDGLLRQLPVAALDSPADRSYAELRVVLEQTGRPIGPNDLLIAAHALALDLTLITGNLREFSRVPGLRVENWLD